MDNKLIKERKGAHTWIKPGQHSYSNICMLCIMPCLIQTHTGPVFQHFLPFSNSFGYIFNKFRDKSNIYIYIYITREYQLKVEKCLVIEQSLFIYFLYFIPMQYFIALIYSICFRFCCLQCIIQLFIKRCFMLIERSYQRLLFPEKEINEIQNSVYDKNGRRKNEIMYHIRQLSNDMFTLLLFKQYDYYNIKTIML